MPSDREREAIDTILKNIDLAESFLAGTSMEDFGKDVRQFYAVTRALEIISEASRRLPVSVKQAFPDLPWRAIADAGNIYRHGYDLIAPKRVWLTVRDNLPPLRAALSQEH